MVSSPKAATPPNFDGPELSKRFGELTSQCSAIVITLGTSQDSKHLIRRLRQQAAMLGRQLQTMGRANLKNPTAKDPIDPNVPRTLTPDDFVQEVRKCVWDCLEQFTDTLTLDPHQRLALLSRRLWMRGRRLELVTKATVVDPAELLRIIAQGERSLSKASSK